jgi:hypothetical protein
MPPIRTKKVTPKEKQIATAISEIRDGMLKNITVATQKTGGYCYSHMLLRGLRMQ